MYLLSILCVASLFGGMLLFAGGFGTLAFKLLDKAAARSLIRDTFPYFYLYNDGEVIEHWGGTSDRKLEKVLDRNLNK